MGGDFLSFDEALAELQMATHELRSLVAQGEIRAFREDDALKFRRTDVLDLKQSRDVEPGDLSIEGAPTQFAEDVDEDDMVLTPEEDDETGETELLTGIGETETDDFLGLGDDEEVEEAMGDTAETVVPTIDISDEDSIDDTAQTIVPSFSSDEDLLEDTQHAEPPPLLADDDEATEMATQEIDSEEMVSSATQSVEAVGEGEPAPLRFQDAAVDSATEEEREVSAAPAGSRLARARQAGPAASPVFFVLTLLTFVILLFAAPLFYGLAQDRVPPVEPYPSIVEFLEQLTVN